MILLILFEINFYFQFPPESNLAITLFLTLAIYTAQFQEELPVWSVYKETPRIAYLVIICIFGENWTNLAIQLISWRYEKGCTGRSGLKFSMAQKKFAKSASLGEG